MFAALGKIWAALFTMADTVEVGASALNELAHIAKDEATRLRATMALEGELALEELESSK